MWFFLIIIIFYYYYELNWSYFTIFILGCWVVQFI